MARKLLVCSVLVIVLLGVQADSEKQPEDAMDKMLDIIDKIANRSLSVVEDLVHKAEDFMKGVKEKIRQEEDKLMNQIPNPLGNLVKDIVNKIHEAEDKSINKTANMTKCVTDQLQPAWDIVRTTMDGVRDCVTQQTTSIKGTMADLEDLIKQALSLLITFPKDLLSCVKIPPTSENMSCFTEKAKLAASKGLMLVSAISGDMTNIGEQAPVIVRNMVNCGIEERFEAEKTLGKIIENMGACEKQAINNGT